MRKANGSQDDATETGGQPLRADAQRNVGKLLAAAKAVFDDAGLDAPVREIANRAGVGVGTLYRHFPQRADLIAAVFRSEMEACADAAPVLAAEYPPFDALRRWTLRFTELAVTKRGLGAAMVLDDPAFDGVTTRRDQRLRPAFRSLFDAAIAVGEIRRDIDADEFMDAVSSLCMGAHDTRLEYAQRMVSLFIDSLHREPSDECE